MAYKVIILYRLYMPSYFLGTFTEYPLIDIRCRWRDFESLFSGIFYAFHKNKGRGEKRKCV